MGTRVTVVRRSDLDALRMPAQQELLRLIGVGGENEPDLPPERLEEMLEQLWREVAPQARAVGPSVRRRVLNQSLDGDERHLTPSLVVPPPAPSLPPSLPLQILDGPGIETQLSRLNFLPTGCDGVDDLLGGGLRQGQVTELTGEAGTGKTQLCLSAAASAAALGHRVVYVDTGGGFSSARIKEFHRGFVTADADTSEVEQHLALTLDLITVVRVHDVMHAFKVLEELGLGLLGDPGVKGDGGLEGEADSAMIGREMGLLVVDSLSSLLSPTLTRLHHQGYTTMASVASLLRSLAPVHNCAVLYTNHTVSAGGMGGDGGGGGGERGGAGGSGPSVKPALGIRWTSTPHSRLCLSRDGGGAGTSCGAEVIYGPGTGVRTRFSVVGDSIRKL